MPTFADAVNGVVTKIFYPAGFRAVISFGVDSVKL
jgi:hypothetical protein